MKKTINNIVCFLFINLFADLSPYIIHLIAFMFFYPLIDGDITDFQWDLRLALLIILIFGRLFVLPIAYNVLENSEKFIYISKFIKLAKKSVWMKLGILIWAYLSHWSLAYPWFSYGFRGQFTLSLYVGLLGNYLVLFAYWFVEDKIKNIKNKTRRTNHK